MEPADKKLIINNIIQKQNEPIDKPKPILERPVYWLLESQTPIIPVISPTIEPTKIRG